MSAEPKVARYVAQVDQTCDDCGLTIQRGSQMCYVNPPGHYVHEECAPPAQSATEPDAKQAGQVRDWEPEGWPQGHVQSAHGSTS